MYNKSVKGRWYLFDAGGISWCAFSDKFFRKLSSFVYYGKNPVFKYKKNKKNHRGVHRRDLFLPDIFSWVIGILYVLFKGDIFSYHHLPDLRYQKDKKGIKNSCSILYIFICSVRSNICNSVYDKRFWGNGDKNKQWSVLFWFTSKGAFYGGAHMLFGDESHQKNYIITERHYI